MADEANKDEALRCLDIARAARQAGNIDKALKFAEKARALHACPEVRHTCSLLLPRQRRCAYARRHCYRARHPADPPDPPGLLDPLTLAKFVSRPLWGCLVRREEQGRAYAMITASSLLASSTTAE